MTNFCFSSILDIRLNKMMDEITSPISPTGFYILFFSPDVTFSVRSWHCFHVCCCLIAATVYDRDIHNHFHYYFI
jgi:hypothetical protein